MSSRKPKEIFHEIIGKSSENSLERDIDISQIVIPFSKMFGSYKISDIYSGKEKIPFKERDPEYKTILRQEFANSFNVEFKVFRSVVKFPSF
ncbi:MAG: hypothetical protein JSV23_04130 [Promethearchaeota archaeon]|nr:MAG: hypothetical protein JSV23_04130 [Candidatus Lokiarchaeota archaeon]